MPADPPPPPEKGPLCLHAETVRSDWIDYNGHMNVAYYVLIFDHATDAVLELLDLGPAYRTRTSCSVFVAEAHVTYEQEVLAGERLWVESRILDSDSKRFILFHEMYGAQKTDVVATNEVLCVHVDLKARRALPWSVDTAAEIDRIAGGHASLPRPSRAGRAIGLGGRRPR